MVKKEVKNRVGRPKETKVKSGRISVRFSDDEMKQINLYLKKHKISTISKLIRLSVKEKVSQTDLFIDSLK